MQNYRVVILGAKDGTPEGLGRLRHNIKRNFELSDSELDQLLGKFPSTVRQDIPKEVAEKFVQAFDKLGASVELQPEQPSAPTAQTPDPIPRNRLSKSRKNLTGVTEEDRSSKRGGSVIPSLLGKKSSPAMPQAPEEVSPLKSSSSEETQIENLDSSDSFSMDYIPPVSKPSETDSVEFNKSQQAIEEETSLDLTKPDGSDDEIAFDLESPLEDKESELDEAELSDLEEELANFSGERLEDPEESSHDLTGFFPSDDENSGDEGPEDLLSALELELSKLEKSSEPVEKLADSFDAKSSSDSNDPEPNTDLAEEELSIPSSTDLDESEESLSLNPPDTEDHDSDSSDLELSATTSEEILSQEIDSPSEDSDWDLDLSSPEVSDEAEESTTSLEETLSTKETETLEANTTDEESLIEAEEVDSLISELNDLTTEDEESDSDSSSLEYKESESGLSLEFDDSETTEEVESIPTQEAELKTAKAETTEPEATKVDAAEETIQDIEKELFKFEFEEDEADEIEASSEPAPEPQTAKEPQEDAEVSPFAASDSSLQFEKEEIAQETPDLEAQTTSEVTPESETPDLTEASPTLVGHQETQATQSSSEIDSTNSVETEITPPVDSIPKDAGDLEIPEAPVVASAKRKPGRSSILAGLGGLAILGALGFLAIGFLEPSPEIEPSFDYSKIKRELADRRAKKEQSKLAAAKKAAKLDIATYDIKDEFKGIDYRVELKIKKSTKEVLKAKVVAKQKPSRKLTAKEKVNKKERDLWLKNLGADLSSSSDSDIKQSEKAAEATNTDKDPVLEGPAYFYFTDGDANTRVTGVMSLKVEYSEDGKVSGYWKGLPSKPLSKASKKSLALNSARFEKKKAGKKKPNIEFRYKVDFTAAAPEGASEPKEGAEAKDASKPAQEDKKTKTSEKNKSKKK